MNGNLAGNPRVRGAQNRAGLAWLPWEPAEKRTIAGRGQGTQLTEKEDNL